MKKFNDSVAYNAIKSVIEPILDKHLKTSIEAVCRMAYIEGINAGLDECMKIGDKK